MLITVTQGMQSLAFPGMQKFFYYAEKAEEETPTHSEAGRVRGSEILSIR